MTTIYDQNPDIWDTIAETRPSVCAMAKRFAAYGEMDVALGFQRAVKNWVERRGSISNAAEQSARNWLAANPAPEPTPAPSGDVLMVIPPAAKIDAVRRVLAALGCEVIDV